MLTITQAVTDEQIEQVREIFAEYFEFLRTGVDAALEGLENVPPQLSGNQDELLNLPGKYALPEGRLLLAEYDGQTAGCIAFYKLDEGVCEVKRLWVRPQFRGKRVGRALVETLIEEARGAGYSTMLLSTADGLTEAQALYGSLGFEKTEPYFDAPEIVLMHEVFMKLNLLS